MELLFQRPFNDLRQFTRSKTSRYGRSPEMDFTLLKPKFTPTTRALKKGFISEELLTKYCKLIGHKYPEHICSKYNEADDTIPEVLFE